MNSKSAYRSSNGETPVPQIYKRGWPDSTPHDEAIKKTLDEVRRLYPDQAVMGDPEIVQTEEHKKAGEYLVKVLSA